MHANELDFIGEFVRDALAGKNYLRQSVVKLFGGEHIAARFISRAITKGRAKWEASEESRELYAIGHGMSLLKEKLRTLIPPEFGWWVEIDHDIRISVRWCWVSNPAATHIGSASDFDASVVLTLVAGVDWSEQASRAMAAIEEEEAELLRLAQQRRRAVGSTGKGICDTYTLGADKGSDTTATLTALSLSKTRSMIGPKEMPKPRETRETIAAKLAAGASADPSPDRTERRQEAQAWLEGALQQHAERKKAVNRMSSVLGEP